MRAGFRKRREANSGGRVISLDPTEWDFREVASKLGKQHLDLLVDYEYARENPIFRQAVCAWKKRRIPIKPQSTETEKPPDEKIQTLLERGFLTLPEATRMEILKGFPDRPWNFMEWLVHFPAFPRAFSFADSGWRPPPNKFKPLTIERYGRKISPWAYGERVEVLIPWDLYSPGELITGFEKFIEANAPPESREIDPRGRRTTAADRLKCLAALRLNRSEEMKFAEIQQLLGCASHRRNDAFDLLPIYGKKDKWDGAVLRAEEYLRKYSP